MIYLDNHATTPVDPRVVEAMLPTFSVHFGNAASRNHAYGWTAEKLVEDARAKVASLVNADPREIVFTSGATESDNLAVIGAALMNAERGKHIITCQTEHKAVLDSCKHLETRGFEVTYLGVDRTGSIRIEDLQAAIKPETTLVSIMAVNNEVGTVHDIQAISKICQDKGILFHTDATQAAGKIPLDFEGWGISLMSLSAHKMYGPKGVGALVVRRRKPRVRLEPLIHGGGHERGLRSGTLNVSGIVGLGAAADIARREMNDENKRIRAMRDRLHKAIVDELDYVELNGHPEYRHPGNLNLSFAYVEGESLMMGIDDIAVSSGSACTSASLEPSYVLRAMNVGEELAHSSIRFGIGRFNTEADIDVTIERVIHTVRRLRELSPLYEMVKEGIDLSTVNWKAH
ncbi:MAG: IscS subfamily cysteine desulfurase [Planctomycetota bacterium]